MPFASALDMRTLSLAKKVKIARPFESSGLLRLLLYILAVFGLILSCQKIHKDKEALRNQLQDSYKNVEAGETEKEMLRSQIRDMRSEVAHISRRYDATLQKSFSVIAENKERIRTLESAVEMLQIERESLQRQAAAHESSFWEQRYGV